MRSCQLRAVLFLIFYLYYYYYFLIIYCVLCVRFDYINKIVKCRIC